MTIPLFSSSWIRRRGGGEWRGERGEGRRGDGRGEEGRMVGGERQTDRKNGQNGRENRRTNTQTDRHVQPSHYGKQRIGF